MATPQDALAENSAHRPKETKKGGRFTFGGPQSFVKINVGAEKQPFNVLKSLICHHSPFFKAAFTGSFVEAQEQSMDLEDVEVPIFTLFVDWLYTHKIKEEHTSGDRVRMIDFFKLWVLGQRFLTPRLQNAARMAISLCVDYKEYFVDDDQQFKLVEFMDTFREWFCYAYDNTAKDSPLRKLSIALMMALLLAWSESTTNPTDNNDITGGIDFIDTLPPEMAVDILKCIAKGSFSFKNAFQLAVEDCHGSQALIED